MRGFSLVLSMPMVAAWIPAPQISKQRIIRYCQDEKDKEWDWDVYNYQGQHEFVYRYGQDLVEIVDAQPGERILDLGCGTGELTQALHEFREGCHAMGMDADLGMVQKAEELFSDCTFFQGDMRNFTVDQPVDAIFSNAAIHWVPSQNIQSCAQCIASALKENGRLVVEFGGKGNLETLVQEVARVVPRSTNPWYFPSISDFSGVLESNGIEVTSAHLFDRPTKLEDGERGLTNWLRMFGNDFFQGFSEQQTLKYFDEIEDGIRGDLFDGDSWSLDYRRIRIVGRKIMK